MSDKYNLWQIIYHMKDKMDFKVLESKITVFKGLVEQGHASTFVKSALEKGKMNIGAEFVEGDKTRKLTLVDVDVLKTKSRHGEYILTDVSVVDVLVDGESIFQTTKDTGK